MKVAIESIRALMVDVCRAADVPDDKVDFVVDHYLAGELRGKSSHGVAKFCFESRFFSHDETVMVVGLAGTRTAHLHNPETGAATLDRLSLIAPLAEILQTAQQS